MITVKHVAMINLLAGRELVPERLQEACTPAILAATIAPLLDDPAAAEAQRDGFRDALAGLAPPGGLLPSEAAAHAVLDCLERTSD